MRDGAPALGLLLLLAPAASADGPQLELGLESFYYRTAETPLNRADILALGSDQESLRGSLNLKQTLGDARFVFRGYVQRTFGARVEETTWTTRQAYAQYSWGSGVSLRVGKQRLAWGSGFAWNPTNRVEPPKNPFNTSLEQEGALAARMDWLPAAWAGVILVAARGETAPGDLPFDVAARRQRTAAVRARFLVKDTDLALVFSGGRSQRTLVGFDLGRDVAGRVSLHAEGAFYRGAELAPPRDDEAFFRLAAGLLYNHGDNAYAVEYFFNGEGYTDARLDAYLAGLAAAHGQAMDPRLPPAQREQARAAYLAGLAVPYGGGLGLRRHYLQASWTRGTSGGEWTTAARGVVGLSDAGVALAPGVVYAPRGDVTLHLDAVLLLGPQASEFRLAPLRGSLQVRVKVLF